MSATMPTPPTPPWLRAAVEEVLRRLSAKPAGLDPTALSWEWPADPTPADVIAQVLTAPAPDLTSRLARGAGMALFTRLKLSEEDEALLSGLFQAPLPPYGRREGASVIREAAVILRGGSQGYWLVLGEGYVLRVEALGRASAFWEAVFWAGS
jgi:hypothetical protein